MKCLSPPPRPASGAKTLSERMAKDALAAMLAGDARPVADIVRETHGGGVVSDDATLRALCAEIVARSPDEAALLRAGRKKLMGYFVGELMKATKGRADAQKAAPYFAELIGAGGGGEGGGGGAGAAAAGGASEGGVGGRGAGKGEGEEGRRRPAAAGEGGGGEGGGKKKEKLPQDDGGGGHHKS